MMWGGTLHIGNLCNNNYKLCLALRKIGVEAHYVHLERLARMHPLSNPAHVDPGFDPDLPWVHPVSEASGCRPLQLTHEMRSLRSLTRGPCALLWPHGQTDFPGYLSLITRQYSAHSTGSDLRVDYHRSGARHALLRRGYRRSRVAFFNNIDLYAHELSSHTPMEFLPNTVDPDAYGTHSDERPRRDRLRVLLASRITLRGQPDLKGTGQFVEALRLLRQSGQPADVICSGEDPEREALRAACAELAPFIQVIPEDFRADRQRYLAQVVAADIVVDQFGLGAMGGTALDCFMLGRMALVRLDEDAFRACYNDPNPVGLLDSPAQIRDCLVTAADHAARLRSETRVRDWVLRHHLDTQVSERFLQQLLAHDVEIARAEVAT